MSHVLAVWELGANLGHIDRLLLLARALRARGHRTSFLLRDLSRAHARVVVDGFEMGQAPVWLPQLANPPQLVSYANALVAAGWLDAPGLAGLISGWKRWLDLLQPDVLVCDHAPTALLAARGRGLPVWAVGTSFALPPRGEHFPAMASWDPAAQGRCAADSALVLPVANQALAMHGMAPLARLTDLFDGVHCAITSLPELAHYDGHDAGTRFCGPTYVGDSGVAPQWPDGKGARVFAYLAPQHPEFRSLVQALMDSGVRAIVHAKGLSPDAAQRLAGPQLRFEPRALHMDATLAEADLLISHGGLGTVTGAVLAGKPQLAITTHMEQWMTGRRLIARQLGLATPPDARGVDWRQLIAQLLREPRFKAAAQALAKHHRGESAARTGERMADLVLGA